MGRSGNARRYFNVESYCAHRCMHGNFAERIVNTLSLGIKAMTSKTAVSEKESVVAPLSVLSNEAVSRNEEATDKIIPIEKIADLLAQRGNRKVVQCHGVF